MSNQRVRQNVPTTLSCPKCGGQVLLMTRKADGRRFLACRNWYDERVRCDWLDSHVPQHVLMREAGAEPLPGLGL